MTNLCPLPKKFLELLKPSSKKVLTSLVRQVNCYFLSPPNQNLHEKTTDPSGLWFYCYPGIKPSKMEYASASRMASKSSRLLTVQ